MLLLWGLNQAIELHDFPSFPIAQWSIRLLCKAVG